MKKLFLLVAFIATASALYSFAQLVPSQREDSTKSQPAQLLNAYYKLKDALVSNNTTAAATYADELVKAINNIDKQVVNVNDDTRAGLLKDAEGIAWSKDIKLQREKFTTLSTNMFELAKSVKLSAAPIYLQYCPMKKASWLSNDKVIKNPYYGSAMLTCGSVKETIQ